MSDFKLTRGDLVSGVYEVTSILGRGGFAEVYRVEHVELQREYALKLFAPRRGDHAADASRQQRFVREAQAIHDIEHPNIVRLHHYGVDEEDRPFLVMDYVEGRPLSTFTGRMEIRRAFRVVGEVLGALHAVHEAGLLHRDVKPSNVMLGETDGVEWVKLIDFGVAKHYDRSRRDTEWLTLTKADTFVGTPAYTAPELLLNDDPSPSADIYSAGLVLYELVFGERAVSGDNSIEVLSHQLKPLPFELPDEPTLMPEARAVLESMIARDPEERFSSAREAAIALSASLDSGEATAGDFSAGESDVAIQRVEIAPSPDADSDASDAQPPAQFSGRRTRARVVAASMAALLLVVIGVGIAWLEIAWLGGDDGDAETVSSEERRPSGDPNTTESAGGESPPESEVAAEAAPRPAADGRAEEDGMHFERTDVADGVNGANEETTVREAPTRRELREERRRSRKRRKSKKPKSSDDEPITFKPEPVD